MRLKPPRIHSRIWHAPIRRSEIDIGEGDRAIWPYVHRYIGSSSHWFNTSSEIGDFQFAICAPGSGSGAAVKLRIWLILVLGSADNRCGGVAFHNPTLHDQGRPFIMRLTGGGAAQRRTAGVPRWGRNQTRIIAISPRGRVDRCRRFHQVQAGRVRGYFRRDGGKMPSVLIAAFGRCQCGVRHF
jgi:hypothetical protein